MPEPTKPYRFCLLTYAGVGVVPVLGGALSVRQHLRGLAAQVVHPARPVRSPASTIEIGGSQRPRLSCFAELESDIPVYREIEKRVQCITGRL